MAAGRGEFFRSYLEGLNRQAAQPPTVRQRPGRGGAEPGLGGGQPGPNELSPGVRTKARRPQVEPATWSEHRCEQLEPISATSELNSTFSRFSLFLFSSWPKPRILRRKTEFLKTEGCLSEGNFIER